jgi:YHS domain-containing protein
MTIDPVCEMKVNEAAVFHSEYQGKTYYFCSAMCKTMFDRDPRKYVLEHDDAVKE